MGSNPAAPTIPSTLILRPVLLRTDGRARFWGAVIDPRDGKTRILRVVTLEDGETVHNAFFDRDFKDTER